MDDALDPKSHTLEDEIARIEHEYATHDERVIVTVHIDWFDTNARSWKRTFFFCRRPPMILYTLDLIPQPEMQAIVTFDPFIPDDVRDRPRTTALYMNGQNHVVPVVFYSYAPPPPPSAWANDWD